MITFPNPDTLAVNFTSFGLEQYDLFLKAKRLPESTTYFEPDGETYRIEAPARFASLLGVEVPKASRRQLPMSKFLFDDQVDIVKMALDAKRFACWSDCGLGKTLIGLEFARHVHQRTDGRVLIVTMNEITQQWLDETERFYGASLPIHRIHNRQEMKTWCKEGTLPLAVTNYEKWNPEDLDSQIVSEAKHLAGIVLDESSRLKTGGGKQKWALIKSCKGIEYKLSLTATPAPNDTMEFASQASFLEKMRSESEIIWTYFVRDAKTHRWMVKPHARRAFFEFMSSWSIYVRDPRKYGWRLRMDEVPAPTVTVYELEPTGQQREVLKKFTTDATGQGFLFAINDTNAIQRGKLSQAAKGFVYRKGGDRVYDLVESRKPGFIADLVKRDVVDGLQVIVWTIFDAESSLLSAQLKSQGIAHELLTGEDSKSGRVDIIGRFRRGETTVLVSRASMLGWGMNFQCCGSMVFSGFSDSYEQYYQAVRRAYRHGQTKSVRVHIPVVRELEDDMHANLVRKQRDHEQAIAEMETNYIQARKVLQGNK